MCSVATERIQYIRRSDDFQVLADHNLKDFYGLRDRPRIA